jgi:hypothetical protein
MESANHQTSGLLHVADLTLGRRRRLPRPLQFPDPATIADVEAIVAFGANLPFAKLADEAERWLDKPVLQITATTYWRALRSTESRTRSGATARSRRGSEQGRSQVWTSTQTGYHSLVMSASIATEARTVPLRTKS